MEVAQHYFSCEHLTHAPDERRKLGREGRMLFGSRGEEQELLPNQVIKGSLFPVSGLDYGRGVTLLAPNVFVSRHENPSSLFARGTPM
jgi:hypothetical protein